MHSSTHAILVVDDDDFQRELIDLQLSNLGCSAALTAVSGADALKQFDVHQGSIRLIISDLSMPDMDGLVLMRHLAQRGFAGAIILVSGMQDEILSSATGLARAHGLKVIGVLHKPCDPDLLGQLVRQLPQFVGSSSTGNLQQALSTERLQHALANHEFIPWYQPKIDLRSGKVRGVEALARWPQADGGFITPGVFVPALEAAGLADDLFFAITRQVASDMTGWHSQGIEVKSAINLSMDSALNLALPEQLEQIIKSAGLAASDFVIEVTESRLMVERSVAMESLTRLSLMGFTLSIDDFGTGYSSLVQLIDLPFKELKIDGSFVQRSSTEEKAQSILRIAVLLGNNLQMGVIAEGVETQAQLDFLRHNGGTVVQGYYFARPMPYAACTTWMINNLAP